MLLSLVHWVGLGALLVGSYTDLKTREVPDWLNYGLMVFGIGFALIVSLLNFNFLILAHSVVGFLVFVGFGLLMFYAGQWGGGDSKMVMGLGALLGLKFALDPPLFGLSFQDFLPAFLVNSLLVGVVYGMAWAFYMAFKNKKEFAKTSKTFIEKFRFLRIVFLFAIIAAAVAYFFIQDFVLKIYTMTLLILPIITFYLWVFGKAVEKSCMLKKVSPEKLTEGDWIAKDVFVDGKRITGPKDLGIDKDQIKELIQLKKQKKVNLILIKEGIPFVPSFLIAFIITLAYGAWFTGFFII